MGFLGIIFTEGPNVPVDLALNFCFGQALLLLCYRTCQQLLTEISFISFSTCSSHLCPAVPTLLHPLMFFCQSVFKLNPAPPGKLKLSVLSLISHPPGPKSHHLMSPQWPLAPLPTVHSVAVTPQTPDGVSIG